MKKILLILIKLVQHYTNDKVSAESEADSLYNCMVYKSNPLRTIEVFEALEKRIELEMRLEEQKASKICRAINVKWTPKPTILDMKVIDPTFLEPIKN